MVNVAVILTDAARTIIWVNNDFTTITGYSYEEAIGKRPGLLLQGRDTDPSAVKRIRTKLAAEVAFQDSLVNYRKNGEQYICQLTVHPVFDRRNRLTNFIAFEIDGDQHKDEITLPLLDLSRRYQSSSLNELQTAQIYEGLKRLMTDEQLYLQPDISLRDLADRLDTNTKYLSQVINYCSGQNSQHFINAYRVRAFEESIRQMRYKNYTLFGVAQQCGFKNKSTFYKVYRDIADRTPREFLLLVQGTSV